MNISRFAQNLRGPFMIHPQQAAVMLPVVRSVLSGHPASVQEKPEEVKPRKVACEDYLAGTAVPSAYAGKSIYVTYLDGTMSKYDTYCSYGTRTIANGLLKADADPDIIGHIIVADSGGGSSDSVHELADAIRKLSKPIVSFVDGMAASACLYAISYTARIIAHQPVDQIGCVGTMITVSGWPKFHKDPDGYVSVRIYADQSEEKNADYEEALEGNTQVIRENVLNPLCEMFISDMKANRPSARDDQLHGRTYFAKDVVGTLIDSIGDFASAVQAVMELADQQESQETNNLPGMARYTRLESIPELSEQEYAADGSTILQECQLEAIEQALSNPRPEEAVLQAQVESLTGARQEEVAALEQTIDGLNGTVSQQSARITELENALRVAEARNMEETPAAVQVNADPADETGGQAASSYSEAVEACKEFLNRK